MSIEVVLFDWGHTLFDTPGSVEFITSYASSSGQPISPAHAHALWDAARVRSRQADEIAKGRDKSPALHRECWLSLWSELEARCRGVAPGKWESPFRPERSRRSTLKRSRPG